MTRRQSVNRSGLDELKEGGLSVELGSICALHLELAGHRTKGRRQRAARSVFEGLSWLEHRLFADHPGPVDLLGMARTVHDRPMSIEQLDGRIAYIRNPNRVQEKPATGGRAAVFRRKTRADLYTDSRGFGFGSCFEEIAFRHVLDASRQARFDWRALRR